MGLLDEIAGYVFDTRQQRDSVCGFLWLDECVQMCVMYVPDLTEPRLWLWPDRTSGLVKKGFTVHGLWCVFKIHCVFHLVQKLQNTRATDVYSHYSGAEECDVILN